MADYKKLSELVDSDITIKSVDLPKFVAWDDVNKKYLTDNNWFKGAQKKYPVTLDGGSIVDMSGSQIGSMLEGVMHAGQADIIGATFNVKSNGKTGQEIRYFLNALSSAPAKAQQSGYEKAQEQANQLRPQTPIQTTEFGDSDMPDFDEGNEWRA